MDTMTYDELGPFKVLKPYFAKTGVKAFVVVDNVAMGPSIGGVRISPSVSLQEVTRLARGHDPEELDGRIAPWRRESGNRGRSERCEYRTASSHVCQSHQGFA